MAEIFSIRGLKESQDYFSRAAPNAIQQGIDETLNDLSTDIFNVTTILVPVRTGALQASIDVTPSAANEILAKAGMDYASFVDDGTRFMDGRHYFKDPIINQIIPQFSDRLDANITKHLTQR